MGLEKGGGDRGGVMIIFKCKNLLACYGGREISHIVVVSFKNLFLFRETTVK